MSAWRVEKGHIDILVNALIQAEHITREQAAGVGRGLWKENYASVNYRYSENVPVPDYEPEFLTEGESLTRDHVKEAVDCYYYQSCEHPDWMRSLARLCTSALLGDHDYFPEGDGGKVIQWGYESLRQAGIE